MQPLRAHVRKGRLVLDEPTDLPEGEVVELVPLDHAHDQSDELDEERAALQRELESSMVDLDAGNLIDADHALAELRAGVPSPDRAKLIAGAGARRRDAHRPPLASQKRVTSAQ